MSEPAGSAAVGGTSRAPVTPATIADPGGPGGSRPSAFASGSSPDSSSTGRSEGLFWLGLLFILLIGLALRTFSAAYGLPDLYHPDEPKIVERAARFHQGDLNPRFFNWPSLYMYVLAGVYGLVFGGSPDGVAGAFGRSPALFYLVGRLVTALFGTATLWALYLIGRMAYGRGVGILAAGLLAVDLLHVRDSHWITTDVPLTFLITLATLCALRYGRDGRLADAGAAGLVSGLAASMKYPGGLVFLALVAAHAARRPGWPAWRRIAARDTILAAGLAAAGFVAGTPFALLTPGAFVRDVLDEARTVQFGNEADVPGYLFHLLHSLPDAMGWPLYLLALAGLAWALTVRGPRERVLLAVAVPYLVVIVTWSTRFERYAIPLLPVLTLFGAVAVVRGIDWVSARVRHASGPWRAAALAGAVVLLVAPALGRVAAYHRLLAQPDTRALGAAWVEHQVPPGARMALQPYSLSLPVARGQLREAPGSLARLQHPPALASEPVGPEDGYWLVRLDTYDLDRLLGEGVEYVVLSGFVYQRHRRACDRHPVPCRFYADLESRSRLVFSVSSGVEDSLRVGDIYSPLTRLRERQHPGPPIRIYHLPAGGRA
jgi:4-amino-4-deoxy-L-arabinose transferase-like glycosyltransferase